MNDLNRVINPATEEVIAEIPMADTAVAEAAVEKSVIAQREWIRMSLSARRDALRAIAGTVRDHVEELALLECRDVGKPIAEARGRDRRRRRVLRVLRRRCRQDPGRHDPGRGRRRHDLPRAARGWSPSSPPWNFPLPIASWNIAPALAAGNSVVVKPAELTPLSTIRFGELVAALDLPENLVQVVTGPGRWSEQCSRATRRSRRSASPVPRRLARLSCARPPAR